jgi:hypothetical protein
MDKYKEDKIWLNSPVKLDIGKLGGVGQQMNPRKMG